MPGLTRARPTSRCRHAGARHPRPPGDERDRRQLERGRAQWSTPRPARPRRRGGRALIRGYGVMQGYYKQRARGGLRRRRVVPHRRPGVPLRRPAVLRRPHYEMVKSRGANVSPLRGRADARGVPRCGHAFVLGPCRSERGEEVVAVVVPAPGVELDVDELRERRAPSCRHTRCRPVGKCGPTRPMCPGWRRASPTSWRCGRASSPAAVRDARRQRVERTRSFTAGTIGSASRQLVTPSSGRPAGICPRGSRPSASGSAGAG